MSKANLFKRLLAVFSIYGDCKVSNVWPYYNSIKTHNLSEMRNSLSEASFSTSRSPILARFCSRFPSLQLVWRRATVARHMRAPIWRSRILAHASTSKAKKFRTHHIESYVERAHIKKCIQTKANCLLFSVSSNHYLHIFIREHVYNSLVHVSWLCFVQSLAKNARKYS